MKPSTVIKPSTAVGLVAVVAGFIARPLYDDIAVRYIQAQAENTFPAQAVLDAQHNPLIPQTAIDSYLRGFTDEVNAHFATLGSSQRIPHGFYATELARVVGNR